MAQPMIARRGAARAFRAARKVRWPALAVVLAGISASAAGPAGRSAYPASGKLAPPGADAARERGTARHEATDIGQVRVATLYENVTDILIRGFDEMAGLLGETGADLIFRGFWRWSPCPESGETQLPPQYPQDYVERCARRGYTYRHLTEAIELIKSVRPDSIFCGAIPAQRITQLVWDPISGEHFDQEQTWSMALDPTRWGIPLSKEEFQCEFAKTEHWVDPDLDCAEYDPLLVPAYFPDIANADFRELIVSWAQKQIDCGADAIWIDMLFRQAGTMYRLTGDFGHPAVAEAFAAACDVVERIHDYGAAQGRPVCVGSWTAFVFFPYEPPALDFVTGTPKTREVLDMTMDPRPWERRLTLLRYRLGYVPPFFAFIDWAAGDETPLATFSQVLDKQQQAEFLEIMDSFLRSYGIKLAYPVHGGYMGAGATILSFGWSPFYDSLAPEFDTYSTIRRLARRERLESSPAAGVKHP